MVDEQAVYVVDDDAAVRDSLSWLLRSVGLSVESFDSGLSFLEYAKYVLFLSAQTIDQILHLIFFCLFSALFILVGNSHSTDYVWRSWICLQK